MATTNTPFRPTNLRFPTNNQENPNDPDRKLFIAAILSLAFVVVLVFLLHLYIRRLLLRRSVPSTISRLPPIITITSQTSGLAPSLLATIPTFAYETSVTGSTECAVCLSLVEEGETVRILPNCKHVFHVDCVDMWLHAHCTCPVCRAGVEPIKKVVEVNDGGVLRASAEEGGSGPKEESSGSQRLALSLRRMLSSREWSGRRPAVVGNGVAEDVERQ